MYFVPPVVSVNTTTEMSHGVKCAGVWARGKRGKRLRPTDLRLIILQPFGSNCILSLGRRGQIPSLSVLEGGRRENEGILRQSDSRTQSREEAEVYKGVMAQTYSYLAARLQTLNEYCAICDEPHTLVSMIQPSVCTRPMTLHPGCRHPAPAS